MATPLPLPTKILLSKDKNVSFNTVYANMGDSYTQVAPRGLNPKVDTWTISWGVVSETEKTTVEAVLDSVGEWDLLSWTPCGESTVKYFRVKQGSGYKVQQNNSNGTYTITTTLVEQFDVNP